MRKKYQQAYAQFLSEIQKIYDAPDAEFERSGPNSSVVLVSGYKVGTDTREKIIEIGEKRGLLVLAQQLSVEY